LEKLFAFPDLYKWATAFCCDNRFLQGPRTDKKDVAKVREVVHAGKCFYGRNLNYKKGGSTFRWR
jgi:hypothetical protein